MTLTLIGVLAYVGAQLLVGAWVSRRIRTEADYLIAGRRLGYGLGIFTLFATWFGAETCIGAAGRIYESGISGGSADPFGYALCIFLMGAVFAIPLWRLKLTTFADLFRLRYSASVERFAVVLMVPTSLLWAAAQIRAFGQIVSSTGVIDTQWAVAFAAFAVIAYTTFGGLMGDVVTDFIQGIFLIAGLAVLLIAAVGHVGGVGPALEAIDPSRLSFLSTEETFWQQLDSWLVPVLGSLVAQELVSRVLASRSISRLAR